MIERQLQVQDLDGHMLLISCGTALHHAQVALDAEGWLYQIDRQAGTPGRVSSVHYPTAARGARQGHLGRL